MELKTICINYFNSFQKLCNFNTNKPKTNVIAFLTTASYFTAIIPLGFGITYGMASLFGRLSCRCDLTRTQEVINNQAHRRFNPDNLPIQIEESKSVRAYPGDLTEQDKQNIAVNYDNNAIQQLNITFSQAPAITVNIRCQDLFESHAAVIVNAANTHLSGGGGIDGAIHQKGGPQYAEAHKRLKSLYDSDYIRGHAAMLESGALQKQYQIANVIVVAGPQGESTPLKEDELYSCYYNSLVLAQHQKKESIAFPSISTGLFGFSKERAAHVSLKAIHNFIEAQPRTSLKTISIHFLPSDPRHNLEAYEKAAT